MTRNLPHSTWDNVVLFNDEKIRRERYNDERYFSVVDVVAVLTQSDRPRKYRSDLKSKLISEWSEVSEKIGQLKMVASDGKKYLTDAANTKTILRIIQSVPSPKAEPFKQRLATLWNERMEELSNPELWIDRAKARAVLIWKQQWKDDRWIASRLQNIQTRNSFTDILKERWIKDWFEYAVLTNKIYDIWLGVKWWAKEYKNIKWLKKTDNLRDNMDMLEIAIVDLAEAWSHEIIKSTGSEWFQEVQDAVIAGSEIAWEAREKIEKKIWKKDMKESSEEQKFVIKKVEIQ